MLLDRLRGSSAIAGMSRIVLAIEMRDRSNPDVRNLTVIKNNLAPLADPIGFTIADKGVEWEAAASTPTRKTKRERARDLLLKLLSDGPVLQTAIKSAAKDAGISMPTMESAKGDLNIDSVKDGNGGWSWKLSDDKPSESDTPA